MKKNTSIIVRLIIIKGILFLTFSSCAQSSFKGIVTDSLTQNPIAYAHLQLFRDTLWIEGTISDDQGNFELDSVSSQTGFLEVSFLGYHSKHIKLYANDQNRLLKIELNPSYAELDEVVVTARRTSLEFQPGKYIAHIGEDLLSSAVEVGKLLNQLPSVSVDLDGNVSLRNNSNVIIQIDGKRSPLASSDVLAQLAPDAIEKIEVITNPSSKYDADGASGIINIMLKKSRKIGAHASIRLGVGEDNRNSTFLEGNQRWARINVFGNYNYRKNYSEFQSSSSRTGELFLLDILSQRTFEQAIMHSINLGVDYYLTDNQVISLAGSLVDNRHVPRLLTESVIKNLQNSQKTKSTFAQSNSHTHLSMNFNLNYRNDWKEKKQFLELDFRAARFPNLFSIHSDRKGLDLRSIREDEIERRNDILTFSADFQSELMNNTQLEVGVKVESKSLSNLQERTFSGDFNEFVMDEFLYDDQVWASYLSYFTKIKKWSFRTGLRFEHYRIAMNSNGEPQPGNSFNNLFPSISLMRPIAKGEISLSLSRRISRPGIYHLNPFTLIQNEFDRNRGNPQLLPTFSTQVEMSGRVPMRKLQLNITTFLRRQTDLLQTIFQSEGLLTTSSYSNFGKATQIGFELYTRIPWSNSLNSTLSGNFFRTHFDTGILDFNVSQFQQYRASTTWHKNSWDIQLNGQFYPSRVFLQQEIESFYIVDIGVTKKLFAQKGQLSLRWNDIFRTRKTIIHRDTELFREITNNRPLTSRYFYLTYQHRFSSGKNQPSRKRERRRYTNGSVD